MDVTPLTELRDALDDAIRRAYCEPLVPLLEGEDPDAVREITTARVLTNPAAMRQLVAIQTAVWEVVRERVEAEGDCPECGPVGGDADCPRCGS